MDLRRIITRGWVASFGAFGLCLPVLAADGVLEINQTCATQTGCFPVDTPGFPVFISSSAGGHSFRLTGDLQVPDENTTAIVVATSGVTIDLNGFWIRNQSVLCFGTPTTCTTSGTGVGVSVQNPLQTENVEVRNGTVTGMGNRGLSLGIGSRVESVRAHQNAGIGIGVESGSLVTGCVATRNGASGIFALSSAVPTAGGTTISNSSASENGDTGIEAGLGGIVSGSSAFSNDGDGIRGRFGTTIASSTAHGNGGAGIRAGQGSTVSGNIAYQNLESGITAAGGSLVTGNSAYINGVHGIQCGQVAQTGCLVESNMAAENDARGLFLGPGVGYRANVTFNNTQGSVLGGTDLGDNLLN